MVFKAVLVTAVFSSCAVAQLTNGDFSDGLNDWVVKSGTVTDGGGYALFWEDESGILSQEFNIPSGALTLSFDLEMVSVGGPHESEPDRFTAYLYNNPTDMNPLVSNPGVDEFFFYLDNEDIVEIVDTGSFDGATVNLNVSGFGGSDAYLVFELLSGEDEMYTKVSLDNVSISVIPTPGGLILACIGTGLVGWLRRRGITK